MVYPWFLQVRSADADAITMNSPIQVSRFTLHRAVKYFNLCLQVLD